MESGDKMSALEDLCKRMDKDVEADGLAEDKFTPLEIAILRDWMNNRDSVVSEKAAYDIAALNKRIAELEAALTRIANATRSPCEGERWMISIASDALKGEE